MKRINIAFLALACTALATSCSEENLQSGGAYSNTSIVPHPTIGKVDTRATETTTANLASFKTFSFLTGDDKNYMDGVTYNGNGGEWTSQDGTFYWPVTGDLNFYSYAPAEPGSEGTVSITPSAQKLTGFVPYETAATQQDFIYSKAKGNLADNGSTGVDLNFGHALSEITVQAQNSNTAYTVEVSGVKVGNVISKGDFIFPTLAGGNATWSLGTEKSDYTTEWESATTLSSTVSTLDASNTAFMLLPQQLVAETKATNGNYIALKVKITMQGGQVIHDGWAYVAVPTLWEMGKHYNYTVDFTSGAGQDEEGNDIISGTNVMLKVNVTPWDETSKAMPNFIYGINSDSEDFTVKINEGNVNVVINEDGLWKFDLGEQKITSLHNFLSNGQNINKVEYLNLSYMNTSDVTSMRMMFNNCSQLKYLDGTSFDTHNVTDMGGMFQNCKSLTTIDVSKWNTENVTSMGGMFNGCSALTSLNVSGWNTKKVTTMRVMFQNCKSLTTIDVSKWNTENVTDMGWMFYQCDALTQIEISEWNTSKVTNMTGMFAGCPITHLDLSKWNTSNVTNLSGMFNCSYDLESLDLSGWSIVNVTNINKMFSGCTSLRTIYMVGCDEATINKIKSALTEAGLSTDIIKTTR